jgi:hypothetical protein
MVTCILILVFAFMSRHLLSVALWAKALMLLSVICFIVALVLIPFGFPSLDDPCEEDSGKHCGLQCAQEDGNMEYFILCAPYELGTSVFLLFAGEVIVFIGSFFAACVGTRYGEGEHSCVESTCLYNTLLFPVSRTTSAHPPSPTLLPIHSHHGGDRLLSEVASTS